MSSHSSLAVLIAAILAGCASAPQIADVGSVPTTTNTFHTLYAAIDARISHFNSKWQGLEKTQWDDAKLITGGGGVSATAIAARATPVAAAGAALAGYVAIVDRFFGIDKQNLAWTKASHALQCVQAVSSYIAVNAPFLKGIQSPDSPAEDGADYAFRSLRTTMQQVDRTLENRLRINAVSTEPNWSAYFAAVKSAAQQPPAAALGNPQKDANQMVQMSGVSAKISEADLTKLKTAVGRYRSDLDACLAAN